MEQSAGCAEWLILPCHATQPVGQNGMGTHDETTLQGISKKREMWHATPEPWMMSIRKYNFRQCPRALRVDSDLQILMVKFVHAPVVTI